ncbi:MAG: hypothetical protein ACLTDR_14825 [Adlercreutzia equolifaciens]
MWSSSIACWPPPFRASATSAASRRRASTAAATTPLGITEQLIFPEIEYDKIDRTRGMDITFVTNAGDNDSAFALLSALGFPFKSK